MTTRLWTMQLLLAAAVLAAGCRKEARSSEVQAPPGQAWLTTQQLQGAQIATAPVEDAEVGGDLVTTGRIAFDDLKVAHVFTPVTGRVVTIDASPGQHVAKGAPLAVLESPDVGSAMSDVNKAHADLVAVTHELQRQRELYAAHASAQRDLESAQDNEAKARAELERAVAKSRLLLRGAVSADRVSQRYTLRAPIAGEIIARNVNPGTEVQGQYSGAGTPIELFTVGALDEVWGFADVFEMDLPRVQVGARVSVRVIAYPGKTYEGTVDWIAGALDPATRTARVRCTIKNPGRELKPEMYATMGIAVQRSRALAVPREAVLRLGDQTVVFVQTGRSENGLVKFERVPVDVDDTVSGDMLPVRHGLAAGQVVVTHGGILLSGMI